MTRSEMIAYIKANPYHKISHPLFADDEYIYSSHDGCVYDENGYLFEDWDSVANKWSGHNGIRLRDGWQWEDGWYVKETTEDGTICPICGKRIMIDYKNIEE